MPDVSDTTQIANLVLYTASLILAVKRRLWRQAHWLAAFIFIAHSVIYYAAVILQHSGLVAGIPLREWGIALRFHLAIVILSYLIIDRG